MSIVVKNLTFIYNEGSPFETKALDDVSMEIKEGEIVGIIGHTGSGKSTLVQHFNGLLRPTKGNVIIKGMDISDKRINLRELRKKVGFIFQYPEYQIFEETVLKEVSFGLKNIGMDDERGLQERVKEALELVDLDYESFKDKSPFLLSGGEKRRVAIASILAMKPEILIMDEPTAGLDPGGRNFILSKIREIHKKYSMTIVLVSHSMEEVYELTDRVFVMDKGRIVMEGSPKIVFKNQEFLESIGLGVPQVVQLVNRLRGKGIDVGDDVLSIYELAKDIKRLYLRGRKP